MSSSLGEMVSGAPISMIGVWTFFTMLRQSEICQTSPTSCLPNRAGCSSLGVMAKMEKKALSTPDEKRSFDKGQVELVTLSGVTFGRATLQPGWKWSTCVKPIANTESCQAPHLQYHVSGRLRVRMDDGSEDELVRAKCRCCLPDMTRGSWVTTPSL